MAKEEWRKWDPNPHLPKKLELNSLTYNSKGFILDFSDSNFRVKVHFEEIMSFKATDEGKLLSTIQRIYSEYSEYYLDWVFFKIDNSKFIEWFHQENYEMYTDFNIEHYLFKTPNDVIEVLSNIPPSIIVDKK
ncbi:hypothetical protein [Cytobacillus firmus]|uniref:hypothetical protein n=1 Tax=Cytobacillus firmus TaxID=1399 RepID=UPI00216201E0|nr:hypothetical protein [Cytobacillus firmus]MCS0672455.1 hypothetical protein [Cytobacillus firmus]